MFRSAYDNLVPGGCFVAYSVNPEFTLSKPNNTKYWVTILRETLEADRYVCGAEFVTHPPTPFTYDRWSQATYEWVIKEAGLRAFVWHPSEVAPVEIAQYGDAYWHDFHDNCLVTG